MCSATLYIRKSTTNICKKVFWLFLAGFIAIPIKGGAQSLPGNISIEKGGQIWIEGTAGPVDFRCRAEQLSGRGEIENVKQPKTTITEDGKINISVSLPVKSLNCGKRAMNKDMYSALKAQQFPTISYKILDAFLISQDNDSLPKGNRWMNIRTRGVMEIAGVADTTDVTVEGKIIEENKFHVKGCKDIHMDTYNIDPPSKMFGLIRASKNLTVYFNVVVTLQDTTER